MPAGDTRGRRTWWALETGFLDAPLSSLPSPAARLAANVQATGARGGHDLHYRTLRKMGVTMLGHFLGAEGRHARFAPDLGESVAWGDERNRQLMDLVRKLVAERGLPPPEIPEPEPFHGEAPEEVNLSGFGAVVFAAGFRPDYESWVRFPGAFDELGFPVHEEGCGVRKLGAGVESRSLQAKLRRLPVSHSGGVTATHSPAADNLPTLSTASP
jgi:putative flavoprotein involved in K+ transport